MDRNLYDLTHHSYVTGHIGRIQMLTCIPVEAGSSLEIRGSGVFRTAPTRKEIISDCQVDVIGFYVKHRSIYGQAHIDFMNSGVDESQTFTGITVNPAYNNLEYLGLNQAAATIPRHMVEGYNRIFHNFFAVKSLQLSADSTSIAPTDYTWLPTTEAGANNCRRFGRLAARLPHVLCGGNQISTGVPTTSWEANELNDSDALVTVTGGQFDIRDLASIQARFSTETSRAWFNHFYQDVMQEIFGVHIGEDADPRNLQPEMLFRDTHWVSGYDVDGHDDATLGSFQGKTLDRIEFNMRRKMFPEGGMVWVLMVPRYPTVHQREIHPLWTNVNPSYTDWAGDPTIIAAQEPVPWNPSNWLMGGSAYTPPSPSQFQEAYGQHYRFQNSRVHGNYASIPGYPFTQVNAADPTSWYYFADEEYDATFQTSQVAQWQGSFRIDCNKFSLIPSVGSSIFAGA
ncbi:major capsid protein [Microviridae sp.]|nr:major capsid protein [Microviridae sp.]